MKRHREIFHGSISTPISSVGKRSSIDRFNVPIDGLSTAKVKLDVYDTKHLGEIASVRRRKLQVMTTLLCLAVAGFNTYYLLNIFVFGNRMDTMHTPS